MIFFVWIGVVATYFIMAFTVFELQGQEGTEIVLFLMIAGLIHSFIMEHKFKTDYIKREDVKKDIQPQVIDEPSQVEEESQKHQHKQKINRQNISNYVLVDISEKIKQGGKFLMDDIDNISKSDFASVKKGIAFENYCMKLLEYNNYRDIKSTRTTGDQGGDIIAWRYHTKYIFQCKCFNKNSVGNKAVQEAKAAIDFYGAGRSAVITNSHFTSRAKELADANGVELFDREELQKLIDNANAMLEKEIRYK